MSNCWKRCSGSQSARRYKNLTSVCHWGLSLYYTCVFILPFNSHNNSRHCRSKCFTLNTCDLELWEHSKIPSRLWHPQSSMWTLKTLSLCHWPHGAWCLRKSSRDTVELAVSSVICWQCVPLHKQACVFYTALHFYIFFNF